MRNTTEIGLFILLFCTTAVSGVSVCCRVLMAVGVICNVSCAHNLYKQAMHDYSCISTLSLAETENNFVRSL